MALFRKLAQLDKHWSRLSLRFSLMPNPRISNLSAGRIALGYAVIAILWIAFSDALVTRFGLPPAVMTIKGAVFVFVTAALLYLTIRRLVEAVQLSFDELRQTEVYLAEAQRLSHTGSWHLDLAHNRLFWSDEVSRIFGIPSGTPLTYETFLAAVHPDDRAFVDKAWKEALRGATYDIEHRLVNSISGEVRWVREKAKLEFDAKGRATKGIGTVQDITERKHAEEALRSSEERFRAIADYTYDWENWIGLEGKLLWVNPAVERITGYSVDECMSMSDFPIPIVTEVDRKAVASQLKEAVEGSSRNDFEFRVRRKHGAIAWVAASWQPIRDSRGAKLGYRSSMRDITERKKAEDAVRRVETYLAESQRLSKTGSWAFDIASNSYVYLSGECSRIFELDPQEIPTRDAVARLIHNDDWKTVQADFEKLLREKTDTPSEFRIVLPSGVLKHLHVIRHPVLDDAGELKMIVGTVIDTTERKHAEEALRESETRFRTFVDHAADAFFVLDLEQGTIVDVNRRACETLGYTREELIGITPMAFDVNWDRAALESIVERPAAGETVLSDKHWHRRKDGSTFPVEIHTSVFWHGGRPLLLKVARDITDRAQAEEQREKLRQLETELAHLDRLTMLGELTASIAHEVNQPLAGVVSNGGACLRWLAGDVPNLDEAREAARRIVRDGKRAGEIIARIRALTKKAPTPREKLDLNETLRQVLALLGDEAKRKKVDIRTEFADDLSPVSGDQVQLQQVALNLAMNALDAMSDVRERARELVIRTRNMDADQVHVIVEDSGVGLDPDTLQKVFEPFFTTKATGMGMGLSISRSILQSHGGRLWATTREGSGTTFHFTLPKYKQDATDQKEANAGFATV